MSAMTIARGAASSRGSEGAEPTRAFTGDMPASELLLDDAVSIDLRADRLTRQIESFTRAGYRLETRSALQAVVVKPREPRPLRTALLSTATLGLYLLPRALGRRSAYHRVVITVDRSGEVRFV